MTLNSFCLLVFIFNGAGSGDPVSFLLHFYGLRLGDVIYACDTIDQRICICDVHLKRSMFAKLLENCKIGRTDSFAAHHV
jgi:hypothetical protein